MSILANLKKTYYYAKKNGIPEAYYAVKERAYAKKSPMYLGNGYQFEEISEEECEKQRLEAGKLALQPKISILVPTYETNPVFLREMIDSVVNQTYENWELILADASETTVVADEVKSYESYVDSGAILYIKLEENKGISDNTNVALEAATGDYIGLLDHDDFLAKNAFFEMVKAIQQVEEQGKQVGFLYSDEDKCDTEGKKYYDPNIKLEFNFDYLLSNNYICHFLVMRADLMKSLTFRADFDGAQDFDIILRAAIQCMLGNPAEIVHVNQVLYHWRCHDGSTAANPMSKMYAYEAGRRAVEAGLKEYLKLSGAVVQENDSEISRETKKKREADNRGFYANGILVKVLHTKHNGFYCVQYGKNTPREMFLVREDVAVIAYPRKYNDKITSGIFDEQGEALYDQIPAKVSGYLHRAVLQQEVYGAKKEHIFLRDEYAELSDKDIVSNLDLTKEEHRFIVYNPYIVHKA